MGERMSATVIASLSASAETPGMPPFVASDECLAGAGEDLVPAPDFTQADSPNVDPAQIASGDPLQPADEAAVPADASMPVPTRDPDLWLYRKRTVGLLRRYMRLSIEVGRMPSLLGREFFRTRVTSYKASTFEDSVIFVHDVERSLEKLSEFDKQLIAKIVLQEYSQEEAAHLLGCGRRHAVRCYPEALDRVSEIFLKRRLLTRLPCIKPESEKSCQGGKSDKFPLSDSEQTKNKS
jgi:hypothetical protein